MPSSERAAVLVAGGAGFIGSSVVRQLARIGARVVSYDNYLYGRPSHLAGVAGDVSRLDGDVRDVERLRSVLRTEQIRYVVNCTGDTYVPEAYTSPQRFVDINVSGTLALLTAIRGAPVLRMVQLSTTEVYGSQPLERLGEDVRLSPVNTYAVTKLAADRFCYTAFLEHGVPVVVARLFNAYGPRETHPYIIPEIITQLARGAARLSLGNLDAERDLTYVSDTARAIVRVLFSDLPSGDVVNIGSDNCYSVRWLAGQLARIMGVPDVRLEVDAHRLRRHDIPRFRCDNTKLRAATNWSPSIGITAGLRQTVDWYARHPEGWSWEADRHQHAVGSPAR